MYNPSFNDTIRNVLKRMLGTIHRSVSTLPILEKNRIGKVDLQKYDAVPLYLYTEKDSLNRVTVLKETGKENYVVAGRYAGFDNDARMYTRLTDEERVEIEKLLRMGRKDAVISFLQK